MTVIIFQHAPCNILSATLSSIKKMGVIIVIQVIMDVHDYNKTPLIDTNCWAMLGWRCCVRLHPLIYTKLCVQVSTPLLPMCAERENVSPGWFSYLDTLENLKLFSTKVG